MAVLPAYSYRLLTSYLLHRLILIMGKSAFFVFFRFTTFLPHLAVFTTLAGLVGVMGLFVKECWVVWVKGL